MDVIKADVRTSRFQIQDQGFECLMKQGKQRQVVAKYTATCLRWTRLLEWIKLCLLVGLVLKESHVHEVGLIASDGASAQ